MARDGKGLASVLAYMALNQSKRLQELLANLRSIIPKVSGIRFDRGTVTESETEIVSVENDKFPHHVKRDYVGESVLFDFNGISGVSARLASEGRSEYWD